MGGGGGDTASAIHGCLFTTVAGLSSRDMACMIPCLKYLLPGPLQKRLAHLRPIFVMSGQRVLRPGVYLGS